MEAYCERDDEGNIIDPITADIIPKDRVVSIKEGDKVYCFDIKTLYLQKVKSNKYINPYTRVPLTPAVIARIDAYAASIKLMFQCFLPNSTDYFDLTMDQTEDIGDLILIVNEQIDIPGYRGRENLFKLDYLAKINGGTISLYSIDLTTPLGVINWSKDSTGKITIKLQDNKNLISSYTRMLAYAQAKGLDWIIYFIPKKYTTPPPPYDTVLDKDYEKLLELFTKLGKDEYDSDGEYIDTYNVNELYDDLNQYLKKTQWKLLSDQARFLESYLDDYTKFSTTRLVKHLLFSRVVDKDNLENRGVEAFYVKDRYDLPNYQFYA